MDARHHEHGSSGATPKEHRGHHGHGEAGHGAGMHAGHEQLFCRRFFVSLLLSIPVLVYSEMLQALLGFSAPAVPGSRWI